MSTIRATFYIMVDWVRQIFLLQKLLNPVGLSLLLFIGLFAAFAVSLANVKGAIVFVGLIFAAPIAFYCITNMWFGLLMMVIVAYMVPLVGKYTTAPLGILLDALLVLLSFVMIVNLSKNKDWYIVRNPISTLIFVWIYYNVFQVLNPVAESKMAWIFTVRTLAVMHFLYFVACYALNSRKRIINMVKALIILAFAAALYGLKQEFFGFSQTELQWLYADPKRFQLIVQWGRFRVFSICFDPTTFGILMSYMGALCFILVLGPISWFKKFGLLVMGSTMFMAMAYAGSRTPFVLIPAGLIFYCLMTMKRNVLIGVGVIVFLGSLAMMKSTSNPVIYRMQSAFKPGADASVQVRLNNQKLIQPYIQSHPIGAGLGSTGAWGKRFTPNSWLASFAHDSAFVRIAVEMGWIGLLLYMILLFMIIKTAIYYFFRTIDPLIKTLYVGFAVVMFMIILGSYPQEVIPLPPTSIIFYIFLGAIIRLKDFDSPPETQEG